MITRKDIITAKGRMEAGVFTGQGQHEVEITVTGRRDLNRLADVIEKHGRADLAAAVRSGKRFKMNLTPEQAAAIVEEAS